MSFISTHILDTTTGLPAVGIPVQLYHHDQLLETHQTDHNGRISHFQYQNFENSYYRLIFQVKDYLYQQHHSTFFPTISIDFMVTTTTDHYHIPLLLSPYAYSTYRGS